MEENKQQNEPLTNKDETQYERIHSLIQGGYNSINKHHSEIYGFIKKLRETEPKNAAALELDILYNVPTDHSIMQRMDKLRKIISGEEEEE